jgi:hypothetical protein
MMKRGTVQRTASGRPCGSSTGTDYTARRPVAHLLARVARAPSLAPAVR